MQRQALVVALQLEGVVQVDTESVHGLQEAHEQTDGEAKEAEVQLPLRQPAMPLHLGLEGRQGNRWSRHPSTTTFPYIW